VPIFETKTKDAPRVIADIKISVIPINVTLFEKVPTNVTPIKAKIMVIIFTFWNLFLRIIIAKKMAKIGARYLMVAATPIGRYFIEE
tara:strand:+ start:585 stop:845 length:261 start_codon:yes stop_codon:yes gene_type:complete